MSGLALLSEEVLQDCGAPVFEHASTHLGPVDIPTIANNVPHRPHGARLGLPRPEHEPIEPGEGDRTGAHRAGLQGHRDGATGQAPTITDHRDGRPDREHFGMRRRIRSGLSGVGRRRDDTSVEIDDHSTYRNIARIGLLSRSKRCLDQLLIAAHIADSVTKLFKRSRQLVGETQSRRDHPDLLIGVEVGVADDHTHHRVRQP